MGLWLVSAPVACMFLGGVGGALYCLDRPAQARLQSLSAGILITAVADMLRELDIAALQVPGRAIF